MFNANLLELVPINFFSIFVVVFIPDHVVLLNNELTFFGIKFFCFVIVLNTHESFLVLDTLDYLVLILSDSIVARIAIKHGSRFETVDHVALIPRTNVVHKGKDSDVCFKVDDFGGLRIA